MKSVYSIQVAGVEDESLPLTHDPCLVVAHISLVRRLQSNLGEGRRRMEQREKPLFCTLSTPLQRLFCQNYHQIMKQIIFSLSNLNAIFTQSFFPIFQFNNICRRDHSHEFSILSFPPLLSSVYKANQSAVWSVTIKEAESLLGHRKISRHTHMNSRQ
ncbi:hypothetical protein EGR_08802 [Echinococcus granulosus]|uniref:Uncharacterized protein n=1 Tax=Echinococcus granulosus TaxID=6210 RepID=W6UDC6_ECHGR|nr:hypothetical protein EGR_08802 [Echinococcus granulosus]EUB56327.1 hypothetical protein EGR_08802 [Echinococcus granulosus]